LGVAGLAMAGPAFGAGTNSFVPALAAGTNSFAAPADFDCDGKADISRKLHNGNWVVDLSSVNGFGRQDVMYPAYGGSTAIPVPADYDGDCRADLSVKGADGIWYIDYARDGFGAWNVVLPGYGGTNAVPVPADYDGDGRADLSVKSDDGTWFIDYATNGFGQWNAIYHAYGPASSLPVPADYDGDGKADLSVKAESGQWFIDYASDGFGAWNAIYNAYGPGSSLPVPADYDGDRRADLSVLSSTGHWHIDFAADGFGAWNAIYSNFHSGGHFYNPNKRPEPVPADYDRDGRADLALHSDDEFWFIDFSANGVGLVPPNQSVVLWDLSDALGVPVVPTITLQSQTTNSLRVTVRAEGGTTTGRSAATQLRTKLQSVTSSEGQVYDDFVSRTFSNLTAGTNYCVEATAINNEGSSTNVECFKTEAGEPTSGTTSVSLQRQIVTQGPVPYLGSWGPITGARPVRLWAVDRIGDHFISFLRAGHSTTECFGPKHNEVTVTLRDGGSLGPTEIAQIFGAAPRSGVQLSFVACYTTTDTNLVNTVFFNLDWVK
jgi:hypothetical protein